MSTAAHLQRVSSIAWFERNGGWCTAHVSLLAGGMMLRPEQNGRHFTNRLGTHRVKISRGAPLEVHNVTQHYLNKMIDFGQIWGQPISNDSQRGSAFRKRYFQIQFDYCCISVQISPTFIHNDSIDNEWTLIQIMIWRLKLGKPLFGTMLWRSGSTRSH